MHGMNLPRDNRKAASLIDGKRKRLYTVRAEQALGRLLQRPEEIHHHTSDQLVLCQDHAYHGLLHVRTRVLRAGGNPNTDRICAGCRRTLPISSFSSNRALLYNVNQRCRACERSRKRAQTPIELQRAPRIQT